MNPLPGKNEWDAFDQAFPAALSGKTRQKQAEPQLSGMHSLPLPSVKVSSQFGARLVQFGVKPAADRELKNPAIATKVLAAMTGDPDPAASLADIRRLLVGPTRNLHDAMFEEVITILEESDREVQRTLRSLEQKCSSLFHITEGLVFTSKEGKEQYRKQADLFQSELQKSAITHREMLVEMFLVIDSKLEELTADVSRKVEAISAKVDTGMLEAIANQERRMRELEEKCLANRKLDIERLENRLYILKKNSTDEKDHQSEAFAGGLAIIADRLKALRDG